MAVTAAWSTSPSKMPLPCTHSYSAPDRLIPRRITCAPDALSSLLPDTCSCEAPLVLTGLMVEVKVADPDALVPSFAVTVTLAVCAVVGVTLITPVEELIDSPVGRLVAE